MSTLTVLQVRLVAVARRSDLPEALDVDFSRMPLLPTSLLVVSLSSCKLKRAISFGEDLSVLATPTSEIFSDLLGGIDIGGRVEIGHIGG